MLNLSVARKATETSVCLDPLSLGTLASLSFDPAVHCLSEDLYVVRHTDCSFLRFTKVNVCTETRLLLRLLSGQLAVAGFCCDKGISLIIHPVPPLEFYDSNFTPKNARVGWWGRVLICGWCRPGGIILDSRILFWKWGSYFI